MYVILWRYQVRPDRVDDFIAAYGSDGDWARLFRTASGFLGTKLLQVHDTANQFLTLDVWRSAAEFEQFSVLQADSYHRLDQITSKLTLSEARVGAFETDIPPLAD